jgi:hypothetical protein
MGPLAFRCAETSREFDSGFRSTAEELSRIPADYTMNSCARSATGPHPVIVKDARISEDPAQP